MSEVETDQNLKLRLSQALHRVARAERGDDPLDDTPGEDATGEEDGTGIDRGGHGQVG